LVDAEHNQYVQVAADTDILRQLPDRLYHL
jgi:hypothetical protein